MLLTLTRTKLEKRNSSNKGDILLLKEYYQRISWHKPFRSGEYMVIQSNCRNRAMNRKYRLFCCCSVARSWPFVCNPMYFTNRQSLLNTMFTESMMLSTQLICCCPFILPSIFPNMRVFSNGPALVSG